MGTVQDLERALKDVLDPEYPISVVDLGLIRGVGLSGPVACVKLTYTSLGCPCMEMIQDDIRERLLQLEGVEEVQIEIVWEPWSFADLSEEGKAALRRLGVV